MRFTLTTLILLTFCLAAWVLVSMRSDPWIAADPLPPAEIAKLPSFDPMRDSFNVARAAEQSPDGTRHVAYGGDFTRPSVWVLEVGPDSKLLFRQIVPMPAEMSRSDSRVGHFIRDDLIVVYKHDTGQQFCLRRRFPEWWWGHFYRPEVWLALALTVAVLWQTVKERRLVRAGAPAETHR